VLPSRMRNVAGGRILGLKISTLAEGTAVALLIVLFFMWKSTYITPRLVPIFDGNLYLLDAHDLLTGQRLYDWSRPLLMPGIIALFWSIAGENYLPVRFFNLMFTLATAIVLYYSTRSEFGRIPSFLAAIVCLASIEILIWSDHLLVHGLTSLFAILALVTLGKRTYSRSIMGGVFAALSCLARYTSVAIAFPVFIAFAITNRKRPKLIASTILGACLPALIYHLAFPSVFPHFLEIYTEYARLGNTSLPFYYYILNGYSLFGIIGTFGLLALLLPSTYRSDSSRPWAFWIIGSLVFFSITANKDDRFTFEWTPAVVYLSFLFLTKIKDRLSRGLTERLMFPSRSFHQMISGTLLISIVLLQTYTFGTAYVQSTHQPSFYIDNNVLTVADYLENHIPANATFITDSYAPALSYFSGRYGYQIWVPSSAPEYLDYLHNYMRSTGARYFIVFPHLTGTSIEVLENSVYLTLEDTLNVTAIGPVYVFHSTQSPDIANIANCK